MTHEEKDIKLIKQAINTNLYDGVEYNSITIDIEKFPYENHPLL